MKQVMKIGETLVTPRQAELVGLIRANPGITLRRLGALAGIKSPNGVACHLRLLRNKGLVYWEEGKRATLVTTRAAS